MQNVGGDWKSGFPSKNGSRATIADDNGLATIASYKEGAGGHAMLYIEYIDRGQAVVDKIHLIAHRNVPPPAAGKPPTPEIEILEECKQFGASIQGTDDRAESYQYKSYGMNNKQRTALQGAVLKFKHKNLQGRYSYSTAGGFIGRLTTLPKTRGVNCADFIIKVLKDAGITKVKSDLFNSPKRIAGGSIFR